QQLRDQGAVGGGLFGGDIFLRADHAGVRGSKQRGQETEHGDESDRSCAHGVLREGLVVPITSGRHAGAATRAAVYSPREKGGGRQRKRAACAALFLRDGVFSPPCARRSCARVP